VGPESIAVGADGRLYWRSKIYLFFSEIIYGCLPPRMKCIFQRPYIFYERFVGLVFIINEVGHTPSFLPEA